MYSVCNTDGTTSLDAGDVDWGGSGGFVDGHGGERGKQARASSSAVRLGWIYSLGSDGIVRCRTLHFHGRVHFPEPNEDQK